MGNVVFECIDCKKRVTCDVRDPGFYKVGERLTFPYYPCTVRVVSVEAGT